MFSLDLLVLLLSAQAAVASPILNRRQTSFVFDGDAPFSVSDSNLAASLTCPYGNPSAAAPPVLLVHGTATTGQESWGSGYVPALRADGFTPCFITIRKFSRKTRPLHGLEFARERWTIDRGSVVPAMIRDDSNAWSSRTHFTYHLLT